MMEYWLIPTTIIPFYWIVPSGLQRIFPLQQVHLRSVDPKNGEADGMEARVG